MKDEFVAAQLADIQVQDTKNGGPAEKKAKTSGWKFFLGLRSTPGLHKCRVK